MDTRYPSVYVDRLGRQLALWHRYGLSDARAMKLLLLWIGYGLTQYMDQEGRYTFHSFNALRKNLGYKTTVEMIDDVRRSQSFVLLSCDVDVRLLKEYQIPCENRPSRELQDGLTCFFSPLWKAHEGKDGEALPGSIVASRIMSRICDVIDNNALDNINTTCSTAGAVAALGAAQGKGSKNEAEMAMTVEEMESIAKAELEQATEGAKAYFRSLVHSQDQRQHQPIAFLLDWLQSPQRGKSRGYGLTYDEAMEVIDVLIDRELAPHFARDRQFMSPSKVSKPENRIYQVTPYIERYCRDKVARAVEIWRRRRASREASEAARLEAAIRKNRPLSPYEWQDLDGRRWMDDRQGRSVAIKPEAPPRPSDTAQWNYFDKCWTK